MASHSKLSRYALSVFATYGFIPTMNGNASSERTRVARRRGISESAYETEERTDKGVSGRPKERRVERLRGRGGEEACWERSCITSGEVGSGARRT